MMNKEKIRAVLGILLEKQIPGWRLDGSANLFVQGIKVIPRDIDIVTTKEGVDAFAKAFGVATRHLQKTGAYNAAFVIKGVPVDVNFYTERPELNMMDRFASVDWQGLKLLCLPLCDAKRFYELINRKDKVELLSEY